MLQLPQSNPDLSLPPGARRSRRESRGIRNSREIREWQFRISNPFKDMEQENNFPVNLKNQMQNLEYISSKSIKRIEFPQPRRTSNIVKNLQLMQELARKQQLKFNGILCQDKKMTKINHDKYDQSLEPMINMMDDDQISLELHGFYDCRERIDDDFNFFTRDDGQDMMNDEAIMFYSRQEIEPTYGMDEEMDNYLK